MVQHIVTTCANLQTPSGTSAAIASCGAAPTDGRSQAVDAAAAPAGLSLGVRRQ